MLIFCKQTQTSAKVLGAGLWILHNYTFGMKGVQSRVAK